MQLTRRGLGALIWGSGVTGVSLATTGCVRETVTPSPSPSTPISRAPSATGTPSSTPTPTPKLTDQGMARTVVNELRTAVRDHPVIKVDLSADEAELSALIDGKPKTVAWQAGQVNEVSSDIAYVGQTSFDPDQFAFDDLTQLFGVAGALSGSQSNQQLHIVDYNNGEVLMTVTTRPESRPVFFRSDGSPIHELDYTTESGIAEGLRDAIGDRTQLAAIGYDAAQGLWADANHPTEAGVIVRRIRPAKLPTFVTQRREDPPEKLVSSVEVDPAVLAKLMHDLPVKLEKKLPATITWTIAVLYGRPDATITLTVAGDRVVCDLAGLDITSTIPA